MLDPASGLQPVAEEQTPRKVNRKSHVIRIPTLNVTSFLAMSWGLLTFLMLNASFSGPEGVISANVPKGIVSSGTTDKPDPNPTTEIPKVPIIIMVTQVDAVTARVSVSGLSEAPRSFKELTVLLMKIQKNPEKGRNGVYTPDNPIVIQPEAGVRWQHVVNAFNAAVKAQYTSVGFAALQ